MVKALICGGGNGAHVAAGIAAAQPGVESRVLTLFQDEAERWAASLQNDQLTVVDTIGPQEKRITSKPSLVTKDPAAAVKDIDVILFAVPAFAHEQYLVALKPHVQPGTILVGMPGQPGFEFAVYSIWGDVAKQCTVCDFITLPWNCRILQFGKEVQMMAVKTVLPGVVQPPKSGSASDAAAKVQKVLGPLPKLQPKGHYVGMSLSPSNAILHTCIMYGQWKDWDGKPVTVEPLFYNGLSEESAQVLSDVSTEVVSIAKAIMARKSEIDLSNVQHAHDYYLQIYGDEVLDKTSLYTTLRTCTGFQGLKHPMVKHDDGTFSPNFRFRYLEEDVPYGLAVIKGIGDLAGVNTPNINKVLEWAQTQMGKEYIVDGKASGKDMSSTRAPQRYGLDFEGMFA